MNTIISWFQNDSYKIITIIAGAVLVYIIFRITGNRIIKALTHVKFVQGERSIKGTEARIKTLSKVLYKTGAIVLGAVVIIMILSNLGIDIAPILAGAGVAGLAIGFGAQSLVKDFLNGFFILLEDQFVEGDYVKIGDLTGNVEDFNLRRTVLRDYKGYLHIIPNGEIKTTTNLTYGWSRVLIDITIPFKYDTKNILKIINEAGNNFSENQNYQPLLIEPVEVLGIDRFTNTGYVVSIIFKTKPQEQWSMKRKFQQEIMHTFDEKGIDITPRRSASKKTGDK